MAETGVVSASLAGIKGATSFVPGAAESFLPKKPKMEFLLVGFGGFSRVGVVAIGSKALGSAVSSGTTGLDASEVTAVVSSTGTTGEEITRDAGKTLETTTLHKSLHDVPTAAASREALSTGFEVSADPSVTISGLTALSPSFSAFSSFLGSFLSPSRAPKMLPRLRDRERLLLFDLPASAPPTAVVVVEGATAATPRAGPLTATLSIGDVPSWTLLPSILFFGREAPAVVASVDGLAKSLY